MLVDWSDKANWRGGNWNAYVAAGKTREQRKARLDEVPGDMRLMVKSHVETAYKLKQKKHKNN